MINIPKNFKPLTGDLTTQVVFLQENEGIYLPLGVGGPVTGWLIINGEIKIVTFSESGTNIAWTPYQADYSEITPAEKMKEETYLDHTGRPLVKIGFHEGKPYIALVSNDGVTFKEVMLLDNPKPLPLE